MDNRWAIAITQPMSERKALANCHRQGFYTFAPKIAVRYPVGGRMIARHEALFPSYIFVLVVSAWHSLLGTFGISSLIMAGDQPAFVPQHKFVEIRNACRFTRDKNGDDIWVWQGRQSRFKKGEELQIKRGALALEKAIYVGMKPRDRVEVLMNILGKSTSVELAECDLAAA